MDILLDKDGDLRFTDLGDIRLEDSVTQKILIRLKWFLGEWKWNREEGLPYFQDLLKKNPDVDSFESLIRETIFEVEEVTEVGDVSIEFDTETRKGKIYFEAKTDYETIKKEVRI